MSGVIDKHGQWEHCCSCGKFVLIQNLGYEQPTPKYDCGRDLCVTCVDAGIRSGDIEFDNITPAASWQVVESTA